MFAVLAALAVLLPGPVYRAGGWSLATAFAVRRRAVYAGLAAVVVSFVGAVLARPGGRHRGFLHAVGGLLTGLVAVGIPLAYVRAAQRACRRSTPCACARAARTRPRPPPG